MKEPNKILKIELKNKLIDLKKSYEEERDYYIELITQSDKTMIIVVNLLYDFIETLDEILENL